MGTHQKQSEFSILPALTKPAYCVQDIVDMGIVSRTQLYIESKEGRLRICKLGRKTLILHEDFMKWLRGLLTKDAVSEPHRRRALQRWNKTKTEGSAPTSDQTTCTAMPMRAPNNARPARD